MDKTLEIYDVCVSDTLKIKQLSANETLDKTTINALLLALSLFDNYKEVNKEAKKLLKKQLQTDFYKSIIDNTKNFTKVKDSGNRGHKYKTTLRDTLAIYPEISNIEDYIDLKVFALLLLKATKGASWEFAIENNISPKDIWSISADENGILEVAVFDQEPIGLWDAACENLHFLNYSNNFRLPQEIRKMKLKELQYWAFGDFTEAFYIPTLEKLRVIGSRCALPSIPQTISQLQSLSLEISDKEIEGQINILTACPHLKELKIDTVNTDKTIHPNWETILDVVAHLKKLEKLSLESNKMEHLPENIGKLTTLKELDLSDNNLTDLPDTLASLQLLEVLDISSNKMGNHGYLGNYMPAAVFKLKNLRELKVYHYTTSYTQPAKWESKLSPNIKIVY